MKPPGTGFFNDAYLVYELMDTDLHQVIRSSQPLSGAQEHVSAACVRSTRHAEDVVCTAVFATADDHIQYFLYQVLRNPVSVCAKPALTRRHPLETRDSCCAV